MSGNLEREIEELLRRLEGDGPAGGRRRPRPRAWGTQLRRLLTRRWGFLTTEQLVAALVALILVSYIARFALPAIGRYVSLASLTAIAALAVYVVSQELRRRR